MKHRMILFAFVFFASLSNVFAAERPNIIFFLSDDHRADVLGCAGHPVVKTPTIDHLASRGERFTNGFVTTSICAASRATLFTGLFERTHGYTFGQPPISNDHIHDSYPAQLKAAGYRTGFVGKFGVRVEGNQEAIDTMFDSYAPLGRRKQNPDGTVPSSTDTAGDKAIEFIANNPKDKPFCLSVSFNAAHAQDGDKKNHYPHPDTEKKLYNDIRMPRPELDGGVYFESQPDFLRDSMNRDRYFWRWDTEEKYDNNMRNYFRMLSALDRNMGRVVAELQARGLADNTVIIFMGDNGYYMGERGFAGKWSHYEQSLRVPLVIHDPRSEDKTGRLRSDIALNLDIAPTIIQLAGIQKPARYQGTSLLQEIDDSSREGFFCEHRMNNNRIPKWEGFRGKRFVYANYYEQKTEGEFLHDLKNDPDQLKNLVNAPAHAKVLGELRVKTRALSQRYLDERKAATAPAKKKSVLLLGDSISIGYHKTVVSALKDEADVTRPNGNCAGTTNGIKGIDDWLKLAGGKFDVIHFNFGLHDLKAVNANDGKNSNNPDDPRQADLKTYEKNLREIVAKLKATEAKLIFATTTPFPAGVKPFRDPEDASRYNAVAIKIMKENEIEIDDLYHFAKPRLEKIQRPANVHFTPAGSQQLGGEVVKQIRQALKKRAKTSN